MTFQQLEYVVEISKCGSINKAAQKLFLSQSGISTAVRELEQELGIRIFARSNRGLEFTQEGKEFLSYALSLLEQKHRIEGLYKDSRDDAPHALFRLLPAVPVLCGCLFAALGYCRGQPVSFLHPGDRYGRGDRRCV